MKRIGLLITICLAVAIILQFLLGRFPFMQSTFPVNVSLALLWIVLMWLCRKEWGTVKIVKALVSPLCSVYLLAIFVVCCLIIGLFPQHPLPDGTLRTGILARLGFYEFTTSWMFVTLLFLLMTNLGLTILRVGFSRSRHSRRFVINHVGIWLVLFSTFFGSPDKQTLTFPLRKGIPVQTALDDAGLPVTLDEKVELKNFNATYYANGMPEHLQATLGIGGEVAQIEVNSPYRFGLTQDIYLMDFGRLPESGETYCVLQIVKQPWRYVTVLGIFLMAVGAVLLFLQGSGPQNERRE